MLYLFFNFRGNKELKKTIFERYQTKLKGHVEITERPEIVEIERMMNRANSERAQKIVMWHDREVRTGEIYTYEQMREALSFSQRQVEYATENWPCLRSLLNAEKLPHSRNFKKAGNWYFDDVIEEFNDFFESDEDE